MQIVIFFRFYCEIALKRRLLLYKFTYSEEKSNKCYSKVKEGCGGFAASRLVCERLVGF